MEDYWGGGQLGSPQARAITKMKRDNPEEYAKLMRPAKIRLGIILGAIGAFGLGWMILCMVVA